MTAIAAVIALSTPSLAQSTGEPIAVTSAPAIVTSAPLSADPLAPAPVASMPATDPLAAEAAAKPAVRKAVTPKSAAARPPPVTARAASAAPVVAAPRSMISDPDAATSVEPLPSQPEAELVQGPIAEPSALADTNMSNPMIPIAGVAALGILALAGVGLVVRRRRRVIQDADDAARRQFAGTNADADLSEIDEPEPAMIVEHEPEPPTPAMVAETAAVAAAVVAAHEPSPEIDGPVTELPEDFDVSHFGLHAQAAYHGPTEDNPSLSLKHRLSRASGLDQLAEREAEAEVAGDADEAPPTEAAEAHSDKGGFMLGRAGTKPSQKPIIRPAYSN